MSFLGLESKDHFWPLSRTLLINILDDRITDTFVAQLIWERLGYKPLDFDKTVWKAGPHTPIEWSELFPYAPQVITQRKASIHLTRSIPKEKKQLLKKKLDFDGYQITELFPRRTRRATIVNWLLAWVDLLGLELPENAVMPTILNPPEDPIRGHPGDPKIQ